MLARQLAHPVSRQRGRVGIGLVVDFGQLGNQIKIVAFHGFEGVVRLVAVSDLLGEFGFVIFRIGEPNRAGINRLVRLRGHHRHHRARIDAAGQECAERHIGNHTQADRLF